MLVAKRILAPWGNLNIVIIAASASTPNSKILMFKYKRTSLIIGLRPRART